MSTTVPQLERLIHRAGYVEVRKQTGSHHHYRHKVTGASLTVASRKGQRIRPGTLIQIEQQIAVGAKRRQQRRQADDNQHR